MSQADEDARAALWVVSYQKRIAFQQFLLAKLSSDPAYVQAYNDNWSQFASLLQGQRDAEG
jgi:hypothetical protein